MVLQEVVFYPKHAVHSNFVVHVLTDVLELLDYNFNLPKTLLSNILANPREQAISQLSFSHLVLWIREVSDHIQHNGL